MVLLQEDDSELPSTSISGGDGDGSEACVEALNDEVRVYGYMCICVSLILSLVLVKECHRYYCNLAILIKLILVGFMLLDFGQHLTQSISV